MATRDVNMPRLTPGQANYVLERMIRDRRLSTVEVSRYVADMQREIKELEERLQNLRAATAGAAVLARPARRPAVARAAVPARRRSGVALTLERRASQQLQGRYLGLIRQIPENRRAHYAGIAKERGREAAIREMLNALRKGGASAASRAGKPPAPARRARRRAALTPQQAASRQLQGRYLGLIRQIPEARRVHYAKIAKEKGRETAIRQMVEALRK